MSTDAHFDARRPAAATIGELARAQGVVPVESLDDLALDVWASDAELDAFLAEVRQARRADLG